MADTQKFITPDQLLELASKYAPGLEPVVMAVAKKESAQGQDPKAYSPNSVGAIGPMQILSKALGGKYANFEVNAEPGMRDPANPVHSTVAGIKMLANLVKQHGVDGGINAYFTGSPKPNPNASDGLTTARNYLKDVKANMGNVSINDSLAPGESLVSGGTKTTKGYDANTRAASSNLSSNMEQLLQDLLLKNNAAQAALAAARKDKADALKAGEAATESKINNEASQAADKINQQSKLLADLGIADPSGADYQRFTAAKAKREGLADKIVANDAVNPLTDPLGWLAGQVSNIWLKEQHNNLVGIENDAVRSLEEKQRIAPNTLALTPAQTLSQLQDSQNAALANQRADLAGKLADIDTQLARDNISANTGVASNALKQYEVAKADLRFQSELEIRRESQASADKRAREKTPEQQAIERIRSETLAAQQQEATDLANTYSAVTGTQVTPGTIYAKKDEPNVKLIAQFKSTGRFGEDPVEAVQNLKTLGGGAKSTRADIRAASAASERWLARANTTPMLDPQTKQPLPPPKTAKEAAQREEEKLRGAMLADMQAVETNASATDGDNPFLLREGNALTNPELAGNLVFKSLKSAMGPNGLGKTGWNNLATIKLMASQVADGKLTPEVAAQSISQFYTTLAKQQNKYNGNDLLSTGIPKAYTLLNALEIPGVTVFGNGKTEPKIDLFNPAQLESVLTKHKAWALQQKAPQPVGSNFLFQ